MALGLALFKWGRRQEGLVAYQAGLQTVEKPTAMQKLSRTLLAIQARVLG